MSPAKTKRFAHGPKHRIKKRRDFVELQSEGRKLRAPHFLMIFAPSRGPRRATKIEINPTSDSRLGVTITKKVNKRAVQRNKLRRRVRDIFRHHRALLKSSVDIVVIALTGATELEFSEVSNEICSLLRKARLL